MLASLILANPAGLWLLLALPLVLLIHFFQQPSRRLEISTFFLLEAVPPQSLRGRALDKIRNSLVLWLQLLIVLLVVWLTIAPRWTQPRSEQRVLILLDTSASMSAQRRETEEALTELVQTLSAEAEQSTWTLMETYSGAARHYEGTDATALLAQAAQLPTARPRHDFQDAVELAAAWQAQGDRVVLLTDGQEARVDSLAELRVGRAQDNVGLVGAEVWWEEGAWRWSVVLRSFPEKRIASLAFELGQGAE
ncbi:MAG: VWA domain-containing protein [Blastochloris sp.]|nr:VWA domain-containing protein [Blastochloris sp.]